MPENRQGCWELSQRNKDPFLEAWIDDIPKTTPYKAVWEFDRYQAVYKPYEWEGLMMNPNVPYKSVDDLFTNIKLQAPKHPLPTYNKFMLIWVFLVQVPVLTMAAIWLNIYLSKTDEQGKRGNAVILFITLVLTMSFGFLGVAIYLKNKYTSNLKHRVKEVEKLLDSINMSSFARYNIRAVCGKSGAWIELQFLDQSMYMVPSGKFGGMYNNAPTVGLNSHGVQPHYGNQPF